MHRLGFVLKRPKKRMLKADAAERQALVSAYAALRREAEATSAQVFFVDEAHCSADVALRTSPRWGEQASSSSAVCLETGEVAAMPLGGNRSAEPSVAFRQPLRARFAGPLIVVWDNAPAHGGDAWRASLRTPDLRLRLVRLPAYSPDFNADESRPIRDRGAVEQRQQRWLYPGDTPWPSPRRSDAPGGASVRAAAGPSVGH
jgi:hypothetical protein